MTSTKKIAVFGGTGMTGLCVLEEAVQLGIEVQALLRNTSVLPEEYASKIKIIRGDVTDLDAVEKTIDGVDGVVITLGTRNDLQPTTVMSTGVKNAITAMVKFNVKPISVCLSSFLIMPKNIVPPQYWPITEEHGRMLDALEKCDRDWIAVLPPHIADSPRSAFLVKEGALPGGRVVSKRDLASFLIQSLSQPDYYHKQMAISSKQ